MKIDGDEYSVNEDDSLPEDSPFEYSPVSAESVKVVEPIVGKPDRKEKPQAKSGIPNVDEWQDFIGRFVIRGLTQLYLSIVLRDIEDELTISEREMIQLTPEDLSDMAAPLASFANKNKIARKYGRQIIAAADSYESVLAMAFWMRRVNKIAKKHRPMNTRTKQNERVKDGNPGQNDEQGSVDGYAQGTFYVDNPGAG